MTASKASHWLRERQQASAAYIRLSALLGSLAGAATIVQLGGMAWIVDRVLTDSPAPTVPVTAVLIVLAALVVRALAVAGQNRFSAQASDQVRSALRQELLTHMQGHGITGGARASSGTLAAEWLDQVDALHGYFAHFLPQMILCITVPVLILLTAFWLDWLAAVLLLVSAPLIPLFMALVGMGAEKLNQQHMATLGRLSGHFLDAIRGLTTLQLFQYTEPATEDIARVTDDYRRINMKTLRVAFLSSAVLEFFASVAIAVLAIYIGFGLLGYIDYGPAPQLTLFSGLLLLLLAPEFFQPLRQLAQHYHDRASALGAAAQLQERLAESHAPAPVARSSEPADIDDAAICVNALGITFADGRKVLNDVSFRVEPGEIVVIEGPSGSGKSTLLNTLAGFLTATHGQVTVFGRAPGSEAFGWLGQSPFIRQGTWVDNLRLVVPDASREAMRDALAEAGLAHLIDQRPEGLDTAIGEGGIGLSGGQARRLALARIFLARYPLVLMDEPTAGLDQQSEQEIIRAIERLKAKKTTIVIVSHHRAVRNAAQRRLTIDHGSLSNG